MSSTTIFDFYVGIVCTFESSQIAASGGRAGGDGLSCEQAAKTASGTGLLIKADKMSS